MKEVNLCVCYARYMYVYMYLQRWLSSVRLSVTMRDNSFARLVGTAAVWLHIIIRFDSAQQRLQQRLLSRVCGWRNAASSSPSCLRVRRVGRERDKNDTEHRFGLMICY